MDFSRLVPTDWPPVDGIPVPPDALLAALVSAVTTMALLAWFMPRSSARRHAVARPHSAGPSCDYLIDGSSLRALGEPGRALLSSIDPGPSRLAGLTAHLERDCPEIRKEIEALVLYGMGFRHHCSRSDGTSVEIEGEARSGQAFLSIRPASEDARALQQTRDALARASNEVAFLRRVLDSAPILAWRLTPDGQVSWANAPYRARFDTSDADLPDHRINDAFDHVLEEVPLTARGPGTRRRVSIAAPSDSETHWFEVTQRPGTSGETLGFATDADELVAAEASLRRFVETLTETFAHLPIGLAVFDKNRRLGLFNPALTQLVKIDAVWLAGRPSLRDFLERLRETRQMPEQKDFAAWRRKLGELEEGARDGTYEENWVLPSGKILRVTGRPHPQGALAFLFEDISTAIQLERRYRSELELSQATLDRLSEAVAVFDASGSLVFVNAAFERLWGLDPMERLEGPGVTEMTRLWANRCAPSPVWAQLAEFATADEARTSWSAAVETRDGRSLQMLAAPLPDASALVLFRDLTAEAEDRAEDTALRAARAQDAALDALALEQLCIPVESAVRQVMAAIPAAQSPESFKGLSAAAQGLKEGLARAREFRAIAEAAPRAPAAEGPMPALTAALAARGLALDVPEDAAVWSADLRRAAFALGLAAAEIAEPEARVGIRLDLTENLRRLAVSVPCTADAPAADRVGAALARRVVEAASGSFAVTIDRGKARLTADLPLSGKAAPADPLGPAEPLRA